MPNWCSTNMAIKGHKPELQKFTDILNSLPKRTPPAKNGFGPLWLGTLVDALGGNWEEIDCRGHVDPDPLAPASWTLDRPDENRPFVIDEDGVLRLTVAMAWSLSEQFLKFLEEKMPGLAFFYKSTDEFGNFHLRHDPFNLIDKVVYELETYDETYEYTADQRDKFLKDLAGACGLDIPEGITDRELDCGEFADKFSAWRESIPEDEYEREVGYIIWKNV